MPDVPTTLTRSATTAEAVSIATGARAFERDLADRVALQHHGVEGAVDGRERMRAVDERGLHADVDGVVDERRHADEPHDHAELGGRRDVRGLDLLDARAARRPRSARASRTRRSRGSPSSRPRRRR